MDKLAVGFCGENPFNPHVFKKHLTKTSPSRTQSTTRPGIPASDRCHSPLHVVSTAATRAPPLHKRAVA